MVTVSSTILPSLHALTEQLKQAKAAGTAEPRIEAARIAPHLHLDGFMARAMARSEVVEGYDDDEPEKPTRRKRRLSERDIERTIAAHLKAGVGIARTETDPASGLFVVIAGSPEHTKIAPTSTNEWDEVFSDGDH